MKTFHIGICVYPSPIWLGRSFLTLTDCIECRPELPDTEILKMFHEFKPDLVFMQIQTPDLVATETIRIMSETAKVINWTGDVRQPIPKWYYEVAPYVTTCFSNQTDVNVFKRLNFKCEYLQIGIDPMIFNRWENTAGCDVVFMANHYGSMFPMSQFRKQSALILKQAFGRQANILGSGWGASSDGDLNGNQLAESQFYSGSKIGVNISHYDLDRYTSDRLFRIMASGCMCLSHRYKGIEKDFKIGEHLDVFNDYSELRRKVRHYLDNEAERKRIADSGFNLVQTKYTTDNMVREIIKIYEL